MGRLLRCSVALLFAAAAVGAASTPAAAHGDEGTMTVLVAEQAGPNRIRLEVGLVYANDDDLAVDATVTAMLAGPGGATVGPVDLQNSGPTSARYVADVDVPAAGSWEVTVTAEEPTATATTTVVVTETEPVTTVPATTTAPAATSIPARSDRANGSNGGGSAVPWIAAAVAVAVAAGVGAVVMIRRRQRAVHPPSTTST